MEAVGVFVHQEVVDRVNRQEERTITSMNDQQYVKGALRTEAPISTDVMQRIEQTGVTAALYSCMRLAIANGHTLDSLKKHIYYGKSVGTLADILPNMAQGTINPNAFNARTLRLVHAVVGLHTEMAEITEALLAHLQTGESLDWVNMIEECGDLFWYMAIYADVMGTGFGDIKERNNAKLKARFPDKFTEDRAINRDLTVERNVLRAMEDVERKIAEDAV